MSYGQKEIPPLFWISTAGYLIYCFLTTPNFWVSLPIVFFPLFAFRLLWVDNFPNVLFFGMMLQWLTCATQLLYCNFLQITMAEKMKDTVIPGGMMNEATTLNIIGLYAFTIGLFLSVRRLKLPAIQDMAEKYNTFKVLAAYIIVSLIILTTQGLIWAFPSVVQYINFFFYIKWGFFVAAFYLVHKKATFLRYYLYAFILFELFLGVTSFFAGGIMNIILFTFLSVVLLAPRLTLRTYLVGGGICVLVIHFLILWSAVKKEYRMFVSKGRKVQTVLVSAEKARDKYFELFGNVSAKQYEYGINELVNRLGYVQFFAATLDRVPRKVPHQNGEIYLSALQHFIVPRFINPNKAVLDDSKHTEKYTGIKLSGKKKASSFSLGYVADAYIDFGVVGMHIILLLVGYMVGYFYSFLLKPSPNVLWVWIFTSPFLLLMNMNGADTKKALGWILIYFLTVALFQKRIVGTIDPLMRA